MSNLDTRPEAPVLSPDQEAEFEADIAAAGGYWNIYDVNQPGVTNDVEQAFWQQLRDHHLNHEFDSPEANEAAWDAYRADVHLYSLAVNVALMRHLHQRQ